MHFQNPSSTVALWLSIRSLFILSVNQSMAFVIFLILNSLYSENMYAIYFSDSQDGRLRLFGVVKHEAVAVEVAQIFSFELRWNRYQLRFTRSPFIEGSIPPFAVSTFRKPGDLSYYGFFRTRDAAHRFAHFLRKSFLGVPFQVHSMYDAYELRASHMDKESSLF